MLRFHPRRRAAALLGLIVAGCSEGDVCVAPSAVPVASTFGRTGQSIVGGQTSAGYLALRDADVQSIGAVLFVDDDGGDSVLCTGVVVGEGWVLTARHCTDAAELRFRGPNGAVFDVGAAHTHPELDVALLELRAECGPPSSVPLGWSRDGGAVGIGQRAVLAGYGTTESASLGALRFVVESVVDQSATSITVRGSGGGTGACSGDSGGPLLGRDARGAISVLGVLSLGAANCRGIDMYVRLSAAIEWLDGWLGAGDTHAAGCEGIDAVGRCFDGDAVWCDGAELRREVCAPAACGWASDVGGYRCAQDARCRGDHFGECDGNTRRSCAGGEASEQPCAGACGFDGSGTALCL